MADSSASGHINSELTAIGVMWPFTALILLARFYVRTLRHNVGADDWCMLAGWIPYTAVEFIQVHELITYRSLRPTSEISPTDQVAILKFETAEEVLTIIALALAKTAVAALLLRILGKTRLYLRLFIYATITLYDLWSICCFAIAFSICDPPRARWDIYLVEEGKAKCPLTQTHVDFTMILGAYGAFVDIAFALLPILITYRLNITLRKKILICVLLGFGVFAGACSISKTVYFPDAYSSTDSTYAKYGLILWTTLEMPIIIIAGSTPPSYPLFESIFRSKPIVPGSQPLSATIQQGLNRYKNSSQKTTENASVETFNQRNYSNDISEESKSLNHNTGP